MAISRHNTDRGGLFLLFVLLALVSVALLGLGPDAGVAQAQDENVRVTGEGMAGFPSAHGSHVPVCGFLVDATKDEAGSRGSFACELSDRADSLGLPFTSITVEVTSVEAPSEQEATLQGPAVVEVPEGESIEGVPATVLLQAGGAGAGGLRIHLEGVFDGERGDETPGDGDYSLLPQDVTEGSILIELEAPGPSPSPSVTPTGTPTPSPSGSPSPSPSGSPSPRPSPTSSLPPPGPPGPVPGPPTGPPDVPFTLGGTHSTARLMAILGQLSPDGIPRLDDILSVVGPFPVAGLAWWQDDWHAHRCCPRPHLHQGLDLFAPRGTPVVAAVDGYVSQKLNGAVSGLAVEITDAGDTQYFYGHLSAFASGISAGTRVRMGQVIGYIGNTGNASRTSPHLHFEIQPNGIPVPPMPIVDGWLGLSEQRALDLVMQRTGGSSFPDADTIREWIGKALALAGQDVSDELGGETAPQGRPRPASGLLALPPSGPLAAFAAGALFILILMPAVLGGLWDTRRALGRAQGGPRAEPIAEETLPDGELPRVDRHPDPGGAGRHRPAAR